MRPLSVAQQGLWHGYLLNEDRAMFNTAECVVFAGKVDAEALVAAVRATVAECEALAGHYRVEDDTIGFVRADLPLEVARVQVPAACDAEAWVREWCLAALSRPFALESELACRFAVLHSAEGDYLFSCIHHIALDGYGANLLHQRIAERYAAAVKGETPVACRFGAYQPVFDEEAARESDGRNAAAREHWLGEMARIPEVVSFSDRTAPISAQFVRHGAQVPSALWSRLCAFADSQRVGWPDLLLAALSAQLGQVSGRAAQVFGLMVMNRIGSASFDVPCMQMNIAPLCLEIDGKADFATAARVVAARRKAGRRHQHYRYETLRRDLGRVGGEQRLFGPLVNIMPFDRPATYGGVPARLLNISAGPVEDLTIEVHVDASGMPVLDYDANPGCYTQAQVEALQRELLDLLEHWLDAPQLSREAVVEGWLGAYRAAHLICAPEAERRDLAAGESVLAAIRQWAEREPQRPALGQDGALLCYGELLTRAEEIAGALAEAGVGAGDRVGVMLSRTPAAVLAQLGVLLAGAVYVPLDAGQPAERQRAILQAGEVALVLTEAAYQHRLADVHAGPVRLVGQLGRGSRLHAPRSGDATAYLMFTSGSTGTPKGVEISHAALDRFVAGARVRYGVTADDRVLQFAPYNFDASIEEVFVTLASGATLLLRTDALLESMDSFADGLERLDITVLDLPTAFWNEWAVALRAGQSRIPAGLRSVIIGGEAVHAEPLAAWQQAAPAGLRLINTYGPTEATVVATSADLHNLPAARPNLPIGVPLAGVEALVLDRGDRPAGEGELVLGGAQLANGYLADEGRAFSELTVGQARRRVYRTGDRVRLEQGRLVYLGRLDNEFKISGYRIQPGEVEAQLRALEGVDEACVLGLELDGGLRRLVAFVAGPRSGIRGLRRELAERLPAAMLPSDYRHFAALPRTGSNKLDRKALEAHYRTEQTGVTLGSETQRRVQAIWQRVLGLGAIAEQDNFFELGGQSLQTIQIVNRLAAEFGLSVKVSDVFDHPRLADFCAFLDSRLVQREEQVELVW